MIEPEARVSRLVDQLLDEYDPTATPAEQFLGRQFDLGLAWVHFDPGHGGLGLSRKLQMPIQERLHDAGAPHPYARNPVGYGPCAPTLHTHGTDEQKDRYLRPLFTGEDIWCQLYSEPGAGSDLASLSTRAVPDGDEWTVNGQKVWTTLAHQARWGMLLARTDPEVPKHRGLTSFVLDMHASGVEVRPLYQITGDAEFNEVFISEARIADSARLGEVGDGWRISLTMMANDRVAIGGKIRPRGSGVIGKAMSVYERRPPPAKADARATPVDRDRLMHLWVEAEVLRLTNIRAQQQRGAGTPGPESSIGKVISTELNKLISSIALDLLGPEGMLKPDGYPMARPSEAVHWENPQHAFLRARANSLEGGTTEILKNVLAERVLGLPGEARVDKDLPWSRVARS